LRMAQGDELIIRKSEQPMLYEALEDRVYADKGTIRLDDVLYQIVSMHMSLASDPYFVLTKADEDNSSNLP
jgi:hypothetical protein